jgi:hypothetical protein
MNGLQRHTFRLRLAGRDPAAALVFQSARNEFRSALAGVYIDLRRLDRTAPVVLEIACAAGGSECWLAPQQRDGQPTPLPELIRWENVSDFHDERIHRMAAETERRRPPVPRPIGPATPTY